MGLRNNDRRVASTRPAGGRSQQRSRDSGWSERRRRRVGVDRLPSSPGGTLRARTRLDGTSTKPSSPSLGRSPLRPGSARAALSPSPAARSPQPPHSAALRPPGNAEAPAQKPSPGQPVWTRDPERPERGSSRLSSRPFLPSLPWSREAGRSGAASRSPSRAGPFLVPLSPRGPSRPPALPGARGEQGPAGAETGAPGQLNKEDASAGGGPSATGLFDSGFLLRADRVTFSRIPAWGAAAAAAAPSC